LYLKSLGQRKTEKMLYGTNIKREGERGRERERERELKTFIV
jgi:hypothetical protein